MKQNNPHIQKKKKENRKTRNLSNAFQKSNANTESNIKTPEESICSNDVTTFHGTVTEEKFTGLGSYLLQSNPNSNANSHLAEDNKSIQSRMNETTDSKQINQTSSVDTSAQMTPKVQFKKS